MVSAKRLGGAADMYRVGEPAQGFESPTWMGSDPARRRKRDCPPSFHRQRAGGLRRVEGVGPDAVALARDVSESSESSTLTSTPPRSSPTARPTANGLPAISGQRPRAGVDGVGRDGSKVRHVGELARGVDGKKAAGERLSPRPKGTTRNFRERPGCGFHGVGRDSAGAGIHHIGEPARGIDGAGRGKNPRRNGTACGSRQSPGAGVDGVGRDTRR